VRSATYPRRSGQRTTIGVAAAMTLAMLPVFLVGGLMPFMREELELTATRLGAVVAMFFVASAVGSIPGGWFADRWGARRALVASNGITAVSLVAIATFSRSWLHLGWILVLAGIANGSAQPSTNLALMRGVAAHRRGLAFGIKQSAVPTATLLAGMAVPIFAVTLGWRWSFVAGVAIFPIVALALPPQPQQNRARPTVARPSVLSLELLRLALGLGFAVAAVTCLAAFLVEGIVDAGESPGFGALVLVTGSLAAIAMRLAAGWLTDLGDAPSLRAVAALLMVGGVGFVLLAVASSQPLWIVGTVLSFGAGWGWSGLFIHAVAAAYPHAPGAATGVVQVGGFVGGVLGPLLFGRLVDQASFPTAWLAGAVLAFVSACLMVGGKRPATHDVSG
jgi:MFS family permease